MKRASQKPSAPRGGPAGRRPKRREMKDQFCLCERVRGSEWRDHRSFCLPSLLTFWQTPGKQHPAAAGQDVLPVIQLIGDRRTRDRAAGAGVPESFAIAGVEGKNTAAEVAAERDA